MKINLFKIGIIVTISYCGLISLARWGDFSCLLTMELNNLGDFLAGIFGPLMLFWLIIGYKQQQEELKQNTKALEMQADELRKSVEQHKELVNATRRQIAVESKSLEFAIKKHEDGESPNFNLEKVKTSVGRKNIIVDNIVFKNVGKSAYSVHVQIDPEDFLTKDSVDYDIVPENSVISIVWLTLKDEIGKRPKELTITLYFKNVESKEYSLLFNFSLNDKKKYQFDQP